MNQTEKGLDTRWCVGFQQTHVSQIAAFTGWKNVCRSPSTSIFAASERDVFSLCHRFPSGPENPVYLVSLLFLSRTARIRCSDPPNFDSPIPHRCSCGELSCVHRPFCPQYNVQSARGATSAGKQRTAPRPPTDPDSGLRDSPMVRDFWFRSA